MTTTTAAGTDFKVADLNLADYGRKEIELAQHEMPGLMSLREKYAAEQPLAGRPHHRLAAHDDPDRGPDRDAHRRSAPRSAGPAATSSRPRTTPRPPSAVGPEGTPEDPQGVPVFAWKGESLEEYWWCLEQTLVWPDGDGAEHDPRRRRRRHPARPQGRAVRARGRRARSRPSPTPRSTRYILDDDPPHVRGRPAALDQDRRRHQGRDRGDDHRRPPALPDDGGRRAPVPGDQRERLRDEVEVRQRVRLPPLADRRPEPRHRRDDRRQDRARSSATATWARAAPSRCAARALAC